MFRSAFRLFLFVALASAASAQPEGSRGLEVEAGARVALVIGNASYEHATALQNPTNDVEDVSGALAAAGFAVHAHTDLTYGEMGQALADFADDAVGAEVALFFYAGHGVQVEGDNFLVPIDADVVTESQMRYRSIALGEVLSTLDDSEARLKLVFLDACRDNPFRSWRSSAGGWASTQGPSGSVISFATAQGERASDNMSGRNGLFTEAFLEEFYTPGLELIQLLRNVQRRVREASDFEQEPWTSWSYDGDFYFVPAGTTIERPAAGLDARVAEALRLRDTDVAASVVVLEEAAAAGHAEAQSILGWMRLRGEGVPVDTAAGVDLLRAASAQGHAAAQTNLGYAYETGLGVAQDVPEAVRLYRLAAEQGRAAAQNNLASLYDRGLGVVADPAEAARLYALAAGQEHAPAQANLGVLYEAGRGVPADAARSADFYERAALAGHADAMVRLGVLLHDGRGVEADPEAARQWLQRAAGLGQPHARALLAAMD
ncbi:caspase family protein [Rubrivirga marina]|uniref:Caspase family p20 domain-containing protein n=1 Tax=Rubrivirga marina TaxID=1196024 RepID=A0A271J5I6_9BACT|nr:caspase family protein [Rubrivirga marina]PAP77939.1 hypothetical protein BSZ37_16580 [Rubrivirga marina]